MHLVYADDSAGQSISLYGAVVLNDVEFGIVEAQLYLVTEKLIPADRWSTLEEFKARDLFRGEKAFMGIPEADRHTAIRELLATLEAHDIPFIYSAVDRERKARSLAATVDERTLAFGMCVLGVNDWALNREREFSEPQRVPFGDICLFMVDEPADKDEELRHELRATFRRLRAKLRPPRSEALQNLRLRNVHDAMYFGDSKDSVGIQLADLCSYFTSLHLSGHGDADSEAFFRIIQRHAICARPDPEWAQYQHLMRSHD